MNRHAIYSATRSHAPAWECRPSFDAGMDSHGDRGNQETAITRLREYRSTLITAAVTGKIDVREAL